MDNIDVLMRRHSVRQYTDRKIPDVLRKKLLREMNELNKKSGLHMQLFFDEPDCFNAAMARYGKFTGVKNYLSIVGKKSPDLEEKAGYYGEKMVFLAQSQGLNSCWVGMTHGKSKAAIGRGEKEVVLIALGYGKTQGIQHTSKSMEQLCKVKGDMPDWFKRGMEGAMLAPTVINQQKFQILYDGKTLRAKVKGKGFFAKTDLGIVKCDFELASGHSFD